MQYMHDMTPMKRTTNRRATECATNQAVYRQREMPRRTHHNYSGAEDDGHPRNPASTGPEQSKEEEHSQD